MDMSPIVAVSHNHPEHMGTGSRASHYHTHTDAEEPADIFSSGSRVATERPVHRSPRRLAPRQPRQQSALRISHEQDRDHLINKVCESNILIQFCGVRKTYPHFPQMNTVVSTTTIPLIALRPHHGARPPQAKSDVHVHDFSLFANILLDVLHTRDSMTLLALVSRCQ